jgi:hypothetical protein
MGEGERHFRERQTGSPERFVLSAHRDGMADIETHLGFPKRAQEGSHATLIFPSSQQSPQCHELT